MMKPTAKLRMFALFLFGLLILGLGFQGSKLIPMPVAQAQSSTIRTVNLVTNSIIYDPVSQKIYASVPSSVGSNGNSITSVDPVTGTIGPFVFIGSEPNRLAISDNGQYLYVALDGAAALRRFNIPAMTAELQFNLGADSFFGPYYPEDIEVRPGCPQTVAISLQ